MTVVSTLIDQFKHSLEVCAAPQQQHDVSDIKKRWFNVSRHCDVFIPNPRANGRLWLYSDVFVQRALALTTRPRRRPVHQRSVLMVLSGRDQFSYLWHQTVHGVIDPGRSQGPSTHWGRQRPDLGKKKSGDESGCASRVPRPPALYVV